MSFNVLEKKFQYKIVHLHDLGHYSHPWEGWVEIVGWLDVEVPWTFSICVEGSTPSNHGSQCDKTHCSEHQALPKLVLCCSLLREIIRKCILLKKIRKKLIFKCTIMTHKITQNPVSITWQFWAINFLIHWSI